MRRLFLLFVFFVSVGWAQEAQREHRNYVPDEKTAGRIAQAVLEGQFGEKQVSAQLPLIVDGSNKRYWIVQGRAKGGQEKTFGGGYAVWIDKHSGCIRLVTESLK
jgi:hypothetical protein